MTKKILSIILTLCMCISFFGVLPVSAEPEVPETYTYTVTDGKATITSARTWGMEGDIVIPDYLGGYPVVAIGDEAFYTGSTITSITIPDTVKTIGDEAFYGCTSLKTVILSDGLTAIGKSAFSDCYLLESVVIPDSVTEIGDYAFWACGSLTSINIPDGITSIGEATFGECSKLSSVKIPDGVTSIGVAAFYGCTSLTDITIPDSVTKIGAYAFGCCDGLKTVNYNGTKAKFGMIDISDGNESFNKATKSFWRDIFISTSRTGEVDIFIPSLEIGNEVVVALYKGRRMTGVTTATFNGDTLIFSLGKDYDTAKVMAWNTLSGMKPITTPIIIN